MNCANHPENAVAAYCRVCGKPLCTGCTRDVRGVIYCETCLAHRLDGNAPAAGFTAQPIAAPHAPSTGPNPALAGIIGAIPFGLGAIYNGQYAKGLAHFVIFCLLVIGVNKVHDPFEVIFGFAIAFFVIYQIIDAVRSAHAIQKGQPAPDPLGIAQAFGSGERVDTSKVPKAAVVLIGLGVLFLLQTSGIISFSFDRMWPLLLIGLGAWLFARRQGYCGADSVTGSYPRKRTPFIGPAVLVTVGMLSLIENMHGPGWDRTWPVLLLAIGLARLFDHKAAELSPPAPVEPAALNLPPSDVPPSPSSEVKNG